MEHPLRRHAYTLRERLTTTKEDDMGRRLLSRSSSDHDIPSGQQRLTERLHWWRSIDQAVASEVAAVQGLRQLTAGATDHAYLRK